MRVIMPGTRVHQLRSANSSDAGAVYLIYAACTVPGTLPDSSIFLLRAVTLSDPKDDTLERLCSPADFVTYGTQRDLAAAQGGYYRAASYTFRYNDVSIADAAWRTISSSINALVNAYDVFLTAFLTREEGVDTIYPTIDESEKAARIKAYNEKVVAVLAAETTRDAHQRDCRNVKALELSTAQRELAAARADLAAVQPIRTVLDVLAASYPTASATIATSITMAMNATAISSATASQQLAITTPLLEAQRANDAIAGYNLRLIAEVQTPFAALTGTLETRVLDLTQTTNVAQSELAGCDLEMARLQGEVDEARRARDAALAAVREVCTDFAITGGGDGTLAAALSLLLGGE